MANDRMYRFASRRVTSWSKTPLPGYWKLLQVVAIAGFAIFMAIQLLSSQAPADPVVSLPGGGAGSGQQTDPTATAQPTEPAPTTPAPTPGQTGTIDIAGPGGAVLAVPQGAADVAGAALRALFDPTAAGAVPVVGGGTLPVAGRALPDATIGPMTVLEYDEGARYTIAAVTDADGSGTTYSSVTSSVTVVADGSRWAVEVH